MAKKILETVHETVQGLYDSGVVDLKTMRNFDELCIEPPKDLTKSEIKKIRLGLAVSQAIFAKYIGVSTSTVQKWESGEKRPNNMAKRFLYTIQKSGLDIIPVHKDD